MLLYAAFMANLCCLIAIVFIFFASTSDSDSEKLTSAYAEDYYDRQCNVDGHSGHPIKIHGC